MSKKILALPRQLTAENATAVAAELTKYCQFSTEVNIDLSGIDHCDSCGLSTLIYVKNNCRNQGINVIYSEPSKQLFALAKFLKVADWLITTNGEL